MKKISFLKTLIKDSLNLKDNLKYIELGGHHVVKTLELISKSHGMKTPLLKNHFPKKTLKKEFLQNVKDNVKSS
jgi:hypothetical protein